MDSDARVFSISTALGELRAAFTPSGLCRLTFAHEPPGECDRWLRKINAEVGNGDYSAMAYLLSTQLDSYLAGALSVFSVPLDLRGTPFQLRVWDALLEIPYGETRSYAEIAEASGNPRAVRAVGMANHANPVPIIVPCHRVIGSNGSLTGYGGGLDLKRKLLELEGCRV